MYTAVRRSSGELVPKERPARRTKNCSISNDQVSAADADGAHRAMHGNTSIFVYLKTYHPASDDFPSGISRHGKSIAMGRYCRNETVSKLPFVPVAHARLDLDKIGSEKIIQ